MLNVCFFLGKNLFEKVLMCTSYIIKCYRNYSVLDILKEPQHMPHVTKGTGTKVL